MIHTRPASSIAAVLSAFSLACATLIAGPLAVTNPGFEADGDVTGPATITGWTAAATTYGVDAATATEAVRSARLNNPGTLSQLTSETITSGYTYQLTADVGQLASFSGGKAKLELYGGTTGTIWQSLEISPPSGGWLTGQFVRFDATATQAGQTLGIRLLSTGGTELRFDNIRLKRTLDSDYDGLEDTDEATAGSNPNSRDSDGDGAWDGAEVIAGFSPTNPNSRPLRIMCMGDSITAGYTDNPNYNEPFEYGYRSGLYTRLNNAGYKFSYVGYSTQPWFGPPHYYDPAIPRDGDPTKGDTVFPKVDLPAVGQNGHHGYGGYQVNMMNAGWVTSDKPDVILLLIGINGIKKAGDNPSAALASKVDEILAAKSPSAHLIVAQITPYSGFWQELYNYNVYIRDTLVPTKAAQGHNISTADLYSIFLTDPSNYGSSIAPGGHSNSAGNHPNNAKYDQMAERWFQAIEALSLNGPDVQAPSIVSLNPMDGATNTPTGGNLVIVFNEDVQKGSAGNIVIRKTSDNSIVETIPVTSAQVSVSGRNLSIDPSVTLASGTAYHVQMDAGVILDDTTPTPNAFAGIADATRWNFTTTVPDISPPTVSLFSPADNSSGVSLIADLVITFNENIQKGTGTIELRKTSDNTLVESFPVSSAAVSVSGVNVAIDRTVSLEANTGYHLVIPGTAFKDLFDLPYSGTADATTWNFTSGTFSIGPVAVVNHSFENGLGGTGVGSVAIGWTWPGDISWGHQLGNNAGSGNGSAKSYVIQGNANSGNNWELYQITGEVIQTGKTYTLEVDLYAGSGWATDTAGKIQLIARDGSGNISLLAQNSGNFGLTAGAWALNQKVEYTATAAQAGKSLGIGLVTSASNGNLYFDNVRITASSSSGPDTTPPATSSLNPLDNATGVATNSNLTATFDESVQKGAGNIVITQTGGSAFETIPVADARVSVSGAVVTINPNGTLANNTAYHVEIAAGAIEDLAGNDFPGISGTTGWNFTTVAASGGPVILVNYPFLDSDPSQTAGTATGSNVALGPFTGTAGAGSQGFSSSSDTIFFRANATGALATDGDTLAEAVANGAYAGFTLTNNTGSGINPETLTYNLWFTTPGTSTYQISVLADASGSFDTGDVLDTKTFTGGVNTPTSASTQALQTNDISALGVLANGASIQFRLYFVDDSDSNDSIVRVDDLTVNGSAVSESSAYGTWKAANAPTTGNDPSADEDNDGVSNAVEFVLGGLAATHDLDKLPVLSTHGGDMTFTFKRVQSSIDAKTVVSIELSTDLAIWNNPPSPYPVPDLATGVVSPGVTVVKDSPVGFDTVTLTVPQEPDARKFARLKVVQTP